MHAVDDDTFQHARSIVAALAAELTAQEQSGKPGPVDVREVVRRSAPDLAIGGEADYLRSLVARLERNFPIEELWPRTRRPGRDLA